MIKYRRLDKQELEELKEDFVKFLASQSITAPDWQKMKDIQSTKAEELIDLFSNIVLEKVLTKIEYLELISANEIKAFSLSDENARMVGLSLNKKGVDLRNDDELNILLGDSNKLMSYSPEVFELEKKYTKTRAEETFFLLENGASITDKKLFIFIDSLLKSEE